MIANIDRLQQRWQEDPQDVLSGIRLVGALGMAERRAEALPIAERLLVSDPCGESAGLYGRVLAENGRLEEAERVLTPWLKEDRFGLVNGSMVIVLWLSGRVNEAHDLALKLLDVQDVGYGVFEVIAWFFIVTRDVSHAESAISRFEAAGGPQHEALALRGRLHARAGRFEEAEYCWELSLKERHDDTVLGELVQCLFHQGKWQDVVDRTSRTGLPQQALIYRCFALMPLGRWRESLADLKGLPDEKVTSGIRDGLIAMNLISHAKAGHVQEAYDVLTTTWMGERFEPIRHALARRLNRDTEALPAEMESAVAVIDSLISSNDADAFAALIDMFPDRPHSDPPPPTTDTPPS